MIENVIQLNQGKMVYKINAINLPISVYVYVDSKDDLPQREHEIKQKYAHFYEFETESIFVAKLSKKEYDEIQKTPNPLREIRKIERQKKQRGLSANSKMD